MIPSGVFEEAIDRCGPWVIGTIVSLIVAVAIAAAMSGAQEREDLKERYALATKLWMRDCQATGRSIDDCAKTWDNGNLLVETYLGYVSTKR